jgi:hypothetical protein
MSFNLISCPAYQIVNGPSGLGLSESFFPEVNAAITQGQVEGYDDLHWYTSI